MKRLTKRDKWGAGFDYLEDVIDRLAAIEDILGDEYDLDHLLHLLKADRVYKVIQELMSARSYEALIQASAHLDELVSVGFISCDEADKIYEERNLHMSREFGIYPENCTPRQWWGARALIKNGRMVLLPDRQNYERNDTVFDADKSDMFFWMEHTMDAAIQDWVKKMCPREWSDKFELDSDSGRFHCEATPKNSGGSYLYVGVWEV